MLIYSGSSFCVFKWRLCLSKCGIWLWFNRYHPCVITRHPLHFFSDKIIAKCQAQLFIKFGTNPTKTSDGFVLKLSPLLETDFLKEFLSRFSCNVENGYIQENQRVTEYKNSECIVRGQCTGLRHSLLVSKCLLKSSTEDAY